MKPCGHKHIVRHYKNAIYHNSGKKHCLYGHCFQRIQPSCFDDCCRLTPTHAPAGWNSAACCSIFYPWKTIILICKFVFNASLYTLQSSADRSLSAFTWQGEAFLRCLTPFILLGFIRFAASPYQSVCHVGKELVTTETRKGKVPEILRCSSEKCRD